MSPRARIIHGHALEQLAAMPDASVQMCATSPPYWGLRDYGDKGKPWPDVTFSPMPGLPPLTIPASTEPLGLESDPWAYVGHLVALFREVRRVLRDDGVLFLNLGDSYAGSGKGPAGNLGAKHNERHLEHKTGGVVPEGLKPKDLVGIPWRAAFALQADGWYLRSDVIWAKPNPMPESVTDRPTKSHEYVFILAKRARYFWDQEAVREADSRAPSDNGFAGRQGGSRGLPMSGGEGAAERWEPGAGRNPRTVWTIPTQPYPGAHFAVWPPALAERCVKAGSRKGDTVLDPFSGAGTTGMVALRLRRQFLGIEQSERYAEMSRRRIEDDAPLFNRPPEADR